VLSRSAMMAKSADWAGRKVRKPRPIVPTEHAEQVAFVNWVRLAYPKVAKYMTAIPNGGVRAQKTANTLKAEGVSPGFPDLIFCLPRGEYHALFIEMKRTADSRTSDHQKAWHERLRAVGYRVDVAHGFDEALVAFNNYFIKGIA
jgi:VRR-NUC domain